MVASRTGHVIAPGDLLNPPLTSRTILRNLLNQLRRCLLFCLFLLWVDAIVILLARLPFVPGSLMNSTGLEPATYAAENGTFGAGFMDLA